MAPALDGSVAVYGTTGSPKTLTLTTANAGDIIIVGGLCNLGISGFPTGVSSITDVAGLTWHKRVDANVPGGAGDFYIFEYYAVAPSALSSDVITVTFSRATTYLSMAAFGVSGANTSSPFDPNASIPTQTDGGSNAVVSTTDANTFVIGITRQSTNSNPGPGTGFTSIAGAAGGYVEVEYAVFSSAQTNLSVGDGAVSTTNGIIADAIVAAGGGTSVTWGGMSDFDNMPALMQRIETVPG